MTTCLRFVPSFSSRRRQSPVWRCLPLAWLLVLAGCQTHPAPSAATQVTELKAQLDAMTNDWPKLARYQQADARLAPPAAGEVRVVFLGDSITDAWPDSGAYFSQHRYVGRGISGQTTPQMLVRFRQDVIALAPKVVVILAGTNDVAGNTGPYDPVLTEGCLASMAELAQANGIRVVLASVLPAFDYPWRRGLQPAGKIVALNAWIKDYANRTGCTYLDYFSAMGDARQGMKAEYSGDGVHPNAAGYAVMETLAEQTLAAVLAEK